MYTDHYGLTGNPFQLTPDPRFWFESDTHRKAMAYLGYGLAQGEGFIVVTGDIGAGKTTLVGHLMENVDSSRLTAVEIVSTQVEGDDMLRLVTQRFGIDVGGASKAELLDRIERLLHDQGREGKRTLLIVDEAQNLGHSALEELRMLSNFQVGGRALLQIFLLGQPEFRDRVKRSQGLEQLRQRIIATHHLDPMEREEIGAYVEHRMGMVGWDGNPEFSEGAFAAIHDATDGVPRRVNGLMARILLYGAVEELAVIDAGVVESVVADLDADDRQDEQTPSSRPEADFAAEPVQPEWPPRPVEQLDTSPEPEFADHMIEEVDETEATEEPEVVEEPAEPVAFDEPEPTFLRAAPIAFDEPEPAFVPAEPVAEPQPLFSAAEPFDQARLDAIEERLDAQEAALRRVLTLLVDWVEGEDKRPGLGVVGGSAA